MSDNRDASRVLTCLKAAVGKDLDHSCPYLRMDCSHMGTRYCEPYEQFKECGWFKVRAASDMLSGSYGHLIPNPLP